MLIRLCGRKAGKDISYMQIPASPSIRGGDCPPIPAFPSVKGGAGPPKPSLPFIKGRWRKAPEGLETQQHQSSTIAFFC